MPPEQMAAVGEVDLAYESFGDPSDPTMLMVMGLGVQMLGWHEDFCELLADRGFQVVRFDNRDVGRSTKFEGAPEPEIMAVAAGDTSSASYRLSDMAADGVGLLDVLGVDAAHVVGASQGGMIAQTIAIEHPSHVLSLTSIMSSTGNREVGAPHPEAIPTLLTRYPDDREGFAEAAVRTFGVIGTRGLGVDEEYVRERALASYDRGHFPEGIGRQLAAILASGDRTEALRGLDVPTLVIHGEEDVLIDVSGGRATAEVVPGAKLVLYPVMGHDLPRTLWPEFVDLIVENAARVNSGDPA